MSVVVADVGTDIEDGHPRPDGCSEQSHFREFVAAEPATGGRRADDPSSSTVSAPADNPPTITLNCNQQARLVQTFEIQRATNSGFTANLTTYKVVGTATSFLDDSGLSRNTRYCYRMRAINGAGTSAFSTVRSAFTPV
jgi:hypothetical protein